MNIQPLQTSTSTTAASASHGIRRGIHLLLQALLPRWTREADASLLSHRRMGAWETGASFAAQAAFVRMLKREREQEDGKVRAEQK